MEDTMKTVKPVKSVRPVRPVSRKLMFMQWLNDASYLKKLLSRLKKFVIGLNKVLCWKKRLSEIYVMKKTTSFYKARKDCGKIEESLAKCKLDQTWLINYYLIFVRSLKKLPRKDFGNILENYDEILGALQLSADDSKVQSFGEMALKFYEWSSLFEPVELSIDKLIKSIGRIIRKIDDNLSYCLCVI
ncbi:DgyrCDS7863 [Dimorphilus gyrociliatus]|uniref:DgyrCDS7863 n=1 Tax=Dimorphilus gyrociliatus TaxID=2664684 RepID=A0A7I8VSG3_9ANNE|nr:DgyrCDS7863 [Dimorphilus gyrociliatus]